MIRYEDPPKPKKPQAPKGGDATEPAHIDRKHTTPETPPVVSPQKPAAGAKFDRNAYQRTYMRDWRKRQKEQG